MLIVTVVIVLFLLLSWFKPDFMFWLAMTLFLDPGGYVEVSIPRDLLGGVQITDVTFLLLLIPLLSPRISIRQFFLNKRNWFVFLFFCAFTLLYHLLVYGFLTPGASFDALVDTFLYQRLTLVGFVSMLPVYVFYQRSKTMMLRFAFITSAVLASLYSITVFTSFELVPLISYERGLGTDAMRVIMRSYGYGYWFIPAALLMALFPLLRIRYKSLVMMIAFVFLLAVVLTLTRRSILALGSLFLFTYAVVQYTKVRPLISSELLKIFLLGTVAIGLLYIVNPDYFSNAISVVDNIFEFTGGSQSEDSRLNYEIPMHLERFKAHPVFGYGWDELWYSNNPDEGGLSANDVPITAALGMFGGVGVFLYFLFYSILFREMFRSFLVLRFTYVNFRPEYVLNFIVLGVCLVVLLNRFTFSFFTLFNDLIVGEVRVRNMLFIGIFLAALDQLVYSVGQNSSIDE